MAQLTTWILIKLMGIRNTASSYRPSYPSE
jgi:hypothetical protein